MPKKILSLQEVSSNINEEIGKFKPLNSKTGYYMCNFRNGNAYWLEDTKVKVELSFKGTKQPTSFGLFKSKKGYNKKYQNKKEYANYYGEYISYIILKQLEKKVCKVDLGVTTIKYPYSDRNIEIEGVLSHYQLSKSEMVLQANRIVDYFKQGNLEKYEELARRNKNIIDKNSTNVEIILEAFRTYFEKNNHQSEIPEMRKAFFDMCAYDLIFANRDRNEKNFGLRIDQKTEEISFYHLFDNEQILGLQEDRADVQKYLSDEQEFNKFKARELTSCIGIPKKPRHIKPTELLEYLLIHYPEEITESLEDIGRYKVTDLQELMDACEGLSAEHKKLATKIFLEREKEINQIVEKYNSVKKEDDEPSL